MNEPNFFQRLWCGVEAGDEMAAAEILAVHEPPLDKYVGRLLFKHRLRPFL